MKKLALVLFLLMAATAARAQNPIYWGFANVHLSGNTISGDPVTMGVISTVSTNSTAVFDVALHDFPSGSEYAIMVAPYGTGALTWAITNYTDTGFTVTFRTSAGTPTSPSAGFTAAVLVQQ